MMELRFHGRGGQGAVVGGKILATAIFSEGKFVQAFPVFGVERRGAPVTAFVRIDEKKIYLRTGVYSPDHIIILDHTLLQNPSVFEGLKDGGWILINTSSGLDKCKEDLKINKNKIAIVDANRIAIRHKLGSPTSPIVNTAILGALVRVIKLCSLNAICEAIKKGVPTKPQENAMAAKDAFNEVLF